MSQRNRKPKEAKKTEMISYQEALKEYNLIEQDKNYPDWLPHEIIEFLNIKVDWINSSIPTEEEYRAKYYNSTKKACQEFWQTQQQGFYSYSKKEFDFMKRAYTHESLKEIWLCFYNIDKDKTVQLARHIYNISMDFMLSTSSHFTNGRHLNFTKEIYKHALALLESMEKCDVYSYDMDTDLLHYEFKPVLKDFVDIKSNKIKTLSQRNSLIDHQDRDGFVTRQTCSENGKRIFYIRKISYNINNLFNKPYNRYVATLVNVLFDIKAGQYTENDIIKTIKRSPKHDSKNK